MTPSSHVDLPALAAGAPPGSAWEATLPDLRARLVVVAPGESLPGHVNREADVVLVGVSGQGTVSVDDLPHPLAPGHLVILPRGAHRVVSAGGPGLAFLAVHRRTAVSPGWRWRPRRRRPWEDPWDEEGEGPPEAPLEGPSRAAPGGAGEGGRE